MYFADSDPSDLGCDPNGAFTPPAIKTIAYDRLTCQRRDKKRCVGRQLVTSCCWLPL